MVLASVEGLRVRALYFAHSQRLSLGEVGLEEASRNGAGGPASTVEECACPPQYAGDSCQVRQREDGARFTVWGPYGLPVQKGVWHRKRVKDEGRE